MRSYRDQAFVLGHHKLGEADRIVTLLTKANGKVRAVAKGVRRTKSRFGARLETFSQVDLLLYAGRNLDTVTQVEYINSYAERIIQDYPRFACAKVLVEAIDKVVSEERQSSLGHYNLLWGGLNALAQKRYPGSNIVDAFLLRLMSLEGCYPRLDSCVLCETAGNHNGFAVSLGGVVCRACQNETVSYLGDFGAAYLNSLFMGDWQAVLVSSATVQRQAGKVIEEFFTYHLGKELRSLAFFERNYD